MTQEILPYVEPHRRYQPPVVLMHGPPPARINVRESARSYATAASVIGGVAAVAAVRTGPNAVLRGVGAAAIAIGIYGFLNREDLKHLALLYGVELGQRELANQIEDWL